MKIKHLFFLSTFLLSEIQEIWAMDIEKENNESPLKKIKTNTKILDNTVSYKNWDLFRPAYKPIEIFKNKKAEQSILPKEILEFETTQENILTDIDRRTVVKNPSLWPNSIHGQLTLEFPSINGSGSGVLIGPRHLLTAGHNIYGKDPEKKHYNEWAKSISVHLGRNKNEGFKKRNVIKIYTFEEWVQKGDNEFDLALLILDETIGYETGWAGLAALPNDALKNMEAKFKVTGYPGDCPLEGAKEEKGKIMMFHKNNLNTIENEILTYDIDTFKGQSGSGIWVNINKMPYIVGIHTKGGNKFNSGVRISKNKFDEIIKWMDENFENLERERTFIPIENKKNDIEYQTDKEKSIEKDLNIIEIKKEKNINYNNKIEKENSIENNNANSSQFTEKSNQFVTDKLELEISCDELIEELIPSNIYDKKDNGIWKIIKQSIINKDKKTFDLKLNGIKSRNSTNEQDKILCDILKEYENLFVFPNNKKTDSKINLEKIIEQLEKIKNKNEKYAIMKKTAEKFLNLL